MVRYFIAVEGDVRWINFGFCLFLGVKIYLIIAPENYAVNFGLLIVLDLFNCAALIFCPRRKSDLFVKETIFCS